MAESLYGFPLIPVAQTVGWLQNPAGIPDPPGMGPSAYGIECLGVAMFEGKNSTGIENMLDGNNKSVVMYGHEDAAWSGYDHLIESLIQREGFIRLCEIGGGANPSFSPDSIAEKGLDYVIMDISQEELNKAPPSYHKVCADILDENLPGEGTYDLVFTRMLAEHVRDGRSFHLQVKRLLKPGGMAVHFFPTLFAPPSVVNSLLPEFLSEWLLHLMQSGRERAGRQAKFPAHYSWCRGPAARQIQRFEKLGYDVKHYVGFFGHSGFYKKVPGVQKIHRYVAKWLVRHPVNSLTSFAWVVLQKRAP